MDAELQARVRLWLEVSRLWLSSLSTEEIYSADAWQMHMRQRDLIQVMDGDDSSIERALRLLISRLSRSAGVPRPPPVSPSSETAWPRRDGGTHGNPTG